MSMQHGSVWGEMVARWQQTLVVEEASAMVPGVQPGQTLSCKGLGKGEHSFSGKVFRHTGINAYK